ncbi:MAG TPA: hypothetical protein VHL09_15900 [Dehalococcoidia bacterium]|nr:hypothetical protein [Dehalococcoidia bacterium]
MIAREIRRPLRRPSVADLFIWPAMIAVAAGFLFLLAQWSVPIAGLIALLLVVVTWRGWH